MNNICSKKEQPFHLYYLVYEWNTPNLLLSLKQTLLLEKKKKRIKERMKEKYKEKVKDNYYNRLINYTYQTSIPLFFFNKN